MWERGCWTSRRASRLPRYPWYPTQTTLETLCKAASSLGLNRDQQGSS